jgi:phosphoribosylaminoimidazole carboxylase PurE protein
MATPEFVGKVEGGLGGVVILAGSGSDEPHIDKLSTALKKYGIPYEVRIASAHKQSEELLEIIREYDAVRGHLVYIAVAGGTDALSGTSSFVSRRLTISCPPDHPNNSCLNNPPGSSNVYIGRPENAARAVAQIFSEVNLQYTGFLEAEIQKKRASLREEDERLRNKYSGAQG